MTVGYITEKHNQAQILAQALGKCDASQKSQGFYQVGNAVITWAAGHLFRLKQPEEYDAAMNTWSFDTLPFPIDRFEYCIDADSSNGAMKARQQKVVRSLCSHVSRWVIATDDDREGEVIGRQAIHFAGWKGPIGRLIYSAVDVPTFKKALTNEQQASQYEGRYQEGLTRGVVDFVIGLEVTRASHLAFSDGKRGSIVVSAGRVQSPVLNLIEQRCEAIRNFVPRDYFEIEAEFSFAGQSFKLVHAPEDRIFDRSIAEQIINTLPSSATLSLKTVAKRTKPPSLYCSNSMFADAANKLGWHSSKTLEVANRLYLAGHILYPRGDCEYLPSSHAGESGLLLDRLGHVPEICPEGAVGILEAGFSVRNHLYDDSKITAHTAIIPNVNSLKGRQLDLGELGEDDRALYILIARRFLVAHLPDEEYLQTTVSWQAGDGVTFSQSAKVVTKAGWRNFYSTDEEEEGRATLPEELRDGLALPVQSANVAGKVTRPPVFYSEASLMVALEKHGFGKPATFADHIEGLRRRQYVQGTVKKIETTERGREVLKGWRATIADLLTPEMTAYIEERLAAIADGAISREAVISEVRRLSAGWVNALRDAPTGLIDIEKISVVRPPTLKQRQMAKRAAQMLELDLPKEVLKDIQLCSDFLEQHKQALDAAYATPSPEMLRLAEALIKSNPGLHLTDDQRASRAEISAFIDQHVKDAVLPPSDKQVELIKSRADTLGIAVPQSVLQDGSKVSSWLDEHPVKPSVKQLEFARKLAEQHNIGLPQRCAVNAKDCSAFIDKHFKPGKKKRKK